MRKQRFRDDPKDSRQTSTNLPEFDADEVEKISTHLKWAHAMGKQLKELSLSRISLPEVKKLAIANGIPPNDARRYIQFYLAYSEEELDELIALFREANFALRFTCFRVLIAVRDKLKRKELTIRAVQERCGAVELRSLKNETIGSSGGKGGRRPGILKLSGEKLEDTVLRKIKKIASHVEMVVTTKPDLRPEFRRKLQGILNALQ
jgi:hypothetical protein